MLAPADVPPITTPRAWGALRRAAPSELVRRAPDDQQRSCRGHAHPPTAPDDDRMSDVRRRLVIVRHSKTEAYATTDHVRALTDRGKRDAPELGRWRDP